MATTKAIPASPTLSNRIRSLDVLRGFAILGILIANIIAFATPQLAEFMLGKFPILTPAEEWVESIRQFLVAGKFRGTLCLLFGVGMALQYSKLKNTWPGPYAKRTAYLLVLGAIHGILIWYGDILFAYAITAFVAMFLISFSEKTRWIIAISGYAISFLIGIGMMVFMNLSSGSSASQVPEEFVKYVTPSAEIAVYQSGTYLQQLAYRGGMFAMNLFNMVFLLFNLLPLFLIGTIIGTQGVLAAPSKHQRIVKPLLIVSSVGVLLNFIPIAVQALGISYDLSMAVELSFAAPMAIFYALGLAIIYEKAKNKELFRPLEVVGRTALTCYLMQSVLCTFIFYSFGLKLFGTLDYVQMLAVIPIVWLINIVFATLWLKKFDIGPVEWAWRSASMGKKAPWHKPDTLAAPPTIAAPPTNYPRTPDA